MLYKPGINVLPFAKFLFDTKYIDNVYDMCCVNTVRVFLDDSN